MTPADLPLWAAILVSLFVLAGAAITLVGALGLLRFRTFYERVHAPTLGASLGTLGILAGSTLCFSLLQSRPLVHEALIFLFITLTTPVTLILLTRSALYRERAERQDSPAAPAPDGREPASATGPGEAGGAVAPPHLSTTDAAG